MAACIQRDPKRLYARALAGELRHFTGIEDPYEPPLRPDVHCDTEHETCPESVGKVLAAILRAQCAVSTGTPAASTAQTAHCT